MEDNNFRPRLRYLDVFPLPKKDGRLVFGLRDPQQISPHVLCIPREVAFILQFFDGTHTLEEACAEFKGKVNQEFPRDHLAQVIQMLDQSYFLMNENFQSHFTSLVESFQRAEVREAFHAGNGYSKDAVALQETLANFFAEPKGPGYPNGAVGKRDIQGLVVPHIDLRIGGQTYAWAYKELAETQRPDIAVILGTGHNGLKNLFSLTRKPFSTPLGNLRVDSEFVESLISLYPHDLFADEFAHRTEHTIEFQVLFLQQLFGNAIPIVPILCSFAHWMVSQGETADMIRQFAEALKLAIGRSGRRVCLIASADLAHVGPRYGDREGFEGERLERIKQADLEMLAYTEKVDGEGFLNYISEEKDKRRICGLSPIYILLKAIGAKKGQVLSHSHGEMDGSGSVCSYASVIFES